MLVKLAIFLVLAAVCLAFPAEDLKPVAEGPVGPDLALAAPEGPKSDLQTDSTFWFGRGYNRGHHHHYPVYRSYRPRTYSYYYDYEPYYYSSWW